MLVIKNQIKIKFRLLKILFISIILLNFISCSRKPNLTSFLDQPDIQIGKLELKENSVSFTPQQTTEQKHWSPWQDYSYTVRACFEKANIKDSIEYIEDDFKIINTASNEELNLKMEKENNKICLTWDEKFTYNRLVPQSQEDQINETIIEMKRELIYKQNTKIIFFYFNLNNKQILRSNEISQTLPTETEEKYLENLKDQKEKLNIQPLLEGINFKASFGSHNISTSTRDLTLEIYTKIQDIKYNLNFGTYSLTVQKAGGGPCLFEGIINCKLEFSLNGTKENIQQIKEPNPGDEITIILTPSDQGSQSNTLIQITQTFVKRENGEIEIFEETNLEDEGSLALGFNPTSEGETNETSEDNSSPPQERDLGDTADIELPEIIELTYFIELLSSEVERIPDSFRNQVPQFGYEKKMRIKSLSLPDGNYCFRIGIYYKFQNKNTFQLEEGEISETWQIKNTESDTETKTKTTDYKEFITFTKQQINIESGLIIDSEPEIIHNNQKKPYPDPNQDLKFFLHFTEGDCTAANLTDLDPNKVYWETSIKKQGSQTEITKTSEKLIEDGSDKIITLEKGNQSTDIGNEITTNPFKESKKLELIYGIESELNSRQYLLAQFLESNKLKYLKNSAETDQTTLKALKDDCSISLTGEETNRYKEQNTLLDSIEAQMNNAQIESIKKEMNTYIESIKEEMNTYIESKIIGCTKQADDFYLKNESGNAALTSEDINPFDENINFLDNIESICALLFDSFNDSLKDRLELYTDGYVFGGFTAVVYRADQTSFCSTKDADCFTQNLDKEWFKTICKNQFDQTISKAEPFGFRARDRSHTLFKSGAPHNIKEYFNVYFAFTTEKKIILNKNNRMTNSNLENLEEIEDSQRTYFPLLRTLLLPHKSNTKPNPILFYQPKISSWDNPPIEDHFAYFNNQYFNYFYKELNHLFLKTLESFGKSSGNNFQFEFSKQTNFNFKLETNQYKKCWVFKLNKFFMINILFLLLNDEIPNTGKTPLDSPYKDQELFKGNGFVYCPEVTNQSPLLIEETYYSMTFNQKTLHIRNTDTMKMLQLIETLYNQTKSTVDTCQQDITPNSNNVIDSFFNHIQNIQNDYNQQSLMVLDAQFTYKSLLYAYLIRDRYQDTDRRIISAMGKTPIANNDFLLDLNDLSNSIELIEDSRNNCPKYLTNPAQAIQNNKMCLFTTYRKFLTLPLPLPNSQNMFSPPPFSSLSQ